MEDFSLTAPVRYAIFVAETHRNTEGYTMYYIAYYIGYFIVMLIAAIVAVLLAKSNAAWVVLGIGSAVQLLSFLGNSGATVLEWLIFAAILGLSIWLILRRREAAAAKGREQAQTGWYCRCGRMNSNYVTTCQCGVQKSQIDWRCRCGRLNAGQVTICQCGLRKIDVV